MLPSEGFPARALASSVASPDAEWVAQGFRGHLCLLHCLSLLEPALAVPSPLLLTSVLSQPGLRPGNRQIARAPQYQGEILPARHCKCYTGGEQDYPACTSEAKADGGEHLYSGQPMLLLLGQLNKRLSLRRGLHQPELLRPQEHLGEDSAQCPQLCTHSGEEFYFTAGHA